MRTWFDREKYQNGDMVRKYDDFHDNHLKLALGIPMQLKIGWKGEVVDGFGGVLEVSTRRKKPKKPNICEAKESIIFCQKMGMARLKETL